MAKITLINTIDNTYTNASGYSLYISLKQNFSINKAITISFKNSTPLSSSFLNSSFGALIEDYGFDKFKQIIKLTDLNSNQVSYLKKYFASCRCYV